MVEERKAQQEIPGETSFCLQYYVLLLKSGLVCSVLATLDVQGAVLFWCTCSTNLQHLAVKEYHM